MSETRGQVIDQAGAARMPAPSPASLSPEALYAELMKDYNTLYASVRNALMETNQLGKNEVPETGVLAARAADAIRAQVMMAEDSKAERERWTKNENRWRALDMMAKYHPQSDAKSWIDGARDLCRAAESDDFTA